MKKILLIISILAVSSCNIINTTESVIIKLASIDENWAIIKPRIYQSKLSEDNRYLFVSYFTFPESDETELHEPYKVQPKFNIVKNIDLTFGTVDIVWDLVKNKIVLLEEYDGPFFEPVFIKGGRWFIRSCECSFWDLTKAPLTKPTVTIELNAMAWHPAFDSINYYLISPDNNLIAYCEFLNEVRFFYVNKNMPCMPGRTDLVFYNFDKKKELMRVHTDNENQTWVIDKWLDNNTIRVFLYDILLDKDSVAYPNLSATRIVSLNK